MSSSPVGIRFLSSDVILRLGKYEVYSVEMLFSGVLAFNQMECKYIEYSSLADIPCTLEIFFSG